MSVQERIGKALARGQRRLPKAVLWRRHGEPPTIDGHTLDLQIHAYASLVQAARARSADSDVTTQTIRDGFDTMAEIASGAPVAEVSVHDRTIPGPAGNIPIRLYHPPRTSGRSDAIVWFHQGGGVIGGLETDHTLCTMLSDALGWTSSIVCSRPPSAPAAAAATATNSTSGRTPRPIFRVATAVRSS